MQKRKIIISVILTLILLFISFFIFKIYRILSDNKKIDDEITKIKDEVIIESNENDNKENKQDEVGQPSIIENKLTMDFNKLKTINSDTVGWIKINNTNIDYPIVKGNDNTYYLNHSFYKENNINGWIFMNSNNSSSFTDDNTILFGHNTNSKTMFSELRDIYKGNLGNQIDITIYLENDILNYKVFSIYLENPNNTGNISEYTNDATVNNMKQKSKLNINVEVTKDDQILTLSTCNNVTEDRIIMHAKKLN